MCGPPARRCGSQSLAFTCRRHLRVSRSAPEGCRGNYSLAATSVWFHCLTPRLTCWNTRALKLRAHSGKLSLFTQGTSGLTKQLRWVGIITMGEGKRTSPHSSYLFQSRFDASKNTKYFLSSCPCSIYGWLKKLQSKKNHFAILVSQYFSQACRSSNPESY